MDPRLQNFEGNLHRASGCVSRADFGPCAIDQATGKLVSSILNLTDINETRIHDQADMQATGCPLHHYIQLGGTAPTLTHTIAHYEGCTATVQHDSAQPYFYSGCAHLVNEVLEMLVSKGLPGCDYPIHIRFHEISHDIDVLELCGTGWNCHDVDNIDDIFVSVEVTKELDLPHYPLGVHKIAEYVPNLFYRNLPSLDLNSMEHEFAQRTTRSVVQ